MTGIGELRAAAKRLVESVEYDVNGTHGKGGHGGLTSDKTLRAAGELRVALDRFETAPEPSAENHHSPATVIAGFRGQRVVLPLRLSAQDIGVVLDDTGADVITVDVNGARPDEQVTAIAGLLTSTINHAAGLLGAPSTCADPNASTSKRDELEYAP